MPVIVRYLRGIEPKQTDADLLGRFIDRRDEAAFALLVRRHGPMVYGVCRRILAEKDAEDAFQATFLVLVEKAREVAPRDAVGNWLYGVARRAALLSRRAITRRRERVGEMPERPAPDPLNELRLVLDEELSRLPDTYRTVIVLCDLEGRTRHEAAVILGWPDGTVAGRLSRAREMLATRLARHAPAVSVVAVLAGTASAHVPDVVLATTEPATRVVPATVAALTREVMGVMVRGKLMKIAAVIFLSLACAGFGMLLQAGQNKPNAPKDAPVLAGSPEVPMAPKADDVIWGKEVDGLQLGLAGVAGEYRQGDKMQARVRLRNVGKAEVKITYGLLKEYAPAVTDATGGRMTVAMPPSPRYYVPPTDRVIKPGETVGLFDPVVAVESDDVLRLKGLIRVDTPTTYLAPGKYRIAFGGMIRSHPALSTGAVEFEVREPTKLAEEAFVWGKEVDGVQAGLTLSDARAYYAGESIKMEVRLRNVSKANVTIKHGLLRESPMTVTTATGDGVHVTMPPVLGIIVIPTEQVLKPGETTTLYNPVLAVEARLRGQIGPEPLVGTPTIRVPAGKYKVAVGSIVYSHPTLSTGSVEIEVKDPQPAADREAFTAWGKEVAGLQAGLSVTNADDIRIGGKVKTVVKLRNTGKETITVSVWPLWENYPVVVDARGNRVRTTRAPAVGFEIVPTEHAIKPGETVVVGKTDLLVAEPGERVNVPDGVVDLCAIHVEPGKHKADCIGFVKEHPTLATGTVEFEVKEAVETFTEWGKESGGLQAGLGYKAGEKRAYTHGESVTLVIRVRNVGKEAVKFRYVRQFFLENPPAVTDGKGKSVPLERVTVFGFHALVPVDLAPGKEIEVGERQLELKPTLYGTGKYSVQYERLETPENDKTLSKLATGKLELEVTDVPPAAKHRLTVLLNKNSGWPSAPRCAFLDNDRVLVRPGGPITIQVRDRDTGKVTEVEKVETGGIEVRDAKTGKVLKTLSVPQQFVGDFRLSADRKWLATVTTHDTTGTFTIPSPSVTVWDTTTWKVRGTIDDRELLGMAADGRTILVGPYLRPISEAGKIEVWDVVEKKKLKTAPFEFTRIDAAAISPDGSVVVVSGLNEIAYWKWRDGDAYDRLKVGRKVDGLVFSPDGKFVAEGPDSRITVEVRDVATLKVSKALDDPMQPRVPFSVAGMTFADSGKTLVLGNGVGLIESIPVPHRIHFWDVKSGKLVLKIDLKGGAPSSLDVSPDGKTLAALTADGGVSLRVFDLVTPE